VNNYAWASQTLVGVPVPQSQNNVNNFARWMAAEEPPGDWFNNNDPLNANNILQGDQESFPDLLTASQATAAVLRQGNMRGIYDVLAANGPLNAFSAAVVASPWAASHYGGNPMYIAQIPLPPAVNAPGTPPAPIPPPAPVPPVPQPKKEDMQIFAVNSLKAGFIISADLTSKVGVPGADNGALRNSGLYIIMDGQQGRPQLSDALIASIPTA
jgi:hypothetical protein